MASSLKYIAIRLSVILAVFMLAIMAHKGIKGSVVPFSPTSRSTTPAMTPTSTESKSSIASISSLVFGV
ncbi:hypothetical protein FRX31_017255, partial [Thalictrum thalictroides]